MRFPAKVKRCAESLQAPSQSAAERVLPLLHILDLIVHGAVAVVAGLGELAFRKGGADGAALLGAVGAAGELARAEVRPELREGVFQIFFRDEARPAGLEAGEARGVGDAAPEGFKDGHLPGGVTASAQLLADGGGLALHVGQEGVQQGGFAHAGVAAEGAETAIDPVPDVVQTLAGGVVDADEGQGRFFVGAAQKLRLGEVAFGADDDGLDALVHRDGRKLIQHEGAGGGLGGACHEEQHVEVRHGRADEDVPPGRDVRDDRPAVLGLQRHHVARHGGDLLLAEDAPGLALHDAFRRLNVIKSANAFCDITCHTFSFSPARTSTSR